MCWKLSPLVWQQKEVVELLRGRRSQDSTVINGLSLRNGPSLAGVAPSRSVWLGSSSNPCLLTYVTLLNTGTSHFASSDHVRTQPQESCPDACLQFVVMRIVRRVLSCMHHPHQAFCVSNRKQSVTPCQIHPANKSTGQ